MRDHTIKSDLLAAKKKLIKGIRDYDPATGEDSPDCFTMLYEYDKVLKKTALLGVLPTEQDLIKQSESEGNIDPISWRVGARWMRDVCLNIISIN